jgi:hypothetical protein
LVAGRKPLHGLAFAVLCAAIVAVGAVAFAGAAQVKKLGDTKHTPRPACPKDTTQHPCEAVGSVTGFQLEANGEKQPFKAHKDGKVVAWAIRLSRPNKSQRNFFGDFFKNERFGTAPTARIAVLTRVERHDYKLRRQGPVARLRSHLGDRQLFTLNEPLRIRKGDLLALTYPTWGSNFANDVNRRGNHWRSSRRKGKCSGAEDIQDGKPQTKVGSVRTYGCDYGGARLLYWGYYVPD